MTPAPYRASPASTHRAPVEDWQEVLERLIAGDLVAHARVTALVIGLIRRAPAYDLEPYWPDICQNVLLAVVHSVQRGAIRDPAAFIGYCATITRNEIRRWIRRNVHRRKLEVEAEADDFSQPERRDHDLDLRIDLERALASLPPRERSVLEKLYLEGQSYESAARALDLPLGTLKRLQTQGLRLLRDAIAS